MGRAAATDPLHSFRFHARMIGGGASPVLGIPGASPNDVLQPAGSGVGYIVGGGVEAGFQAVGYPTMTQDIAEYREGIRTYTMKFPGIPTVEDVTFTRGAARLDTAFFAWLLAAIEGNEYRGDLQIMHAQRPARDLTGSITSGPGGGATTSTTLPEELLTPANVKQYILREAFPISVKPAGDMDAGTGDVSLSEMTVAYERFDITLPA